MKINILYLFFLILLGCGKVKEKEDLTVSNDNFFNIVYDTIAVRDIGSTTWISPIVGERQVKFNVTTTVGEDETLPDVLEGTFTFSLGDYAKTVTQTKCSGGYAGTFVLTTSVASTTATNTGGASNILDITDYNPSTSPTSETVDIKNYFFELKVTASTFVPTACATPNPTHDIKVVRFENGDLIMDDGSKGLQYYLRPKLRTVN